MKTWYVLWYIWISSVRHRPLCNLASGDLHAKLTLSTPLDTTSIILTMCVFCFDVCCSSYINLFHGPHHIVSVCVRAYVYGLYCTCYLQQLFRLKVEVKVQA